MKDETEEIKNNVIVEETVTDKNENPGIEEVVTTEIVSTEQVQPTAQEMAFAFLKENGIEANSIEDLKKQPEKIVEKVEFNPYEGILDDDDKAYLNFKKETGRSRKEYEALNTNLDELPKIDLARERVRKESGINLSNQQADEYIASELGIDLEEMTSNDQIKLAQYTKSLLDEKKAEQEKYRKPIAVENKPAEQANPEKQEYVKLDNGAVMLKSDYEKLADNHLKVVEKAKEVVNSVTNFNFEITFDDNGVERKEIFSYEVDEKDRHSMVSSVSDLNADLINDYGTGEILENKQFQEDNFWRKKSNREKAISSIVHKAVAKAKEEILKERGNVNFTNQESLQKQAKDGVTMVSVADAVRGNF